MISFFQLLGFSKKKKPKKRALPPVHNHTVLQSLWVQLSETWFPGHLELHQYRVMWSARAQKKTLASCHYRARKVMVARELNYAQHEQWLEPLLYHEMCHAVLGQDVERHGAGQAWHGKEFKALERKHPRIPALNEWMKSGGWASAVRSDRAKRSWAVRTTSTT